MAILQEVTSMVIGRLGALPPGNSKWARFKDEYSNDWSVRVEKLPEGAKAGDELAYRLDFSQQRAPQIEIIDEDD